jgi:hypothetical protein
MVRGDLLTEGYELVAVRVAQAWPGRSLWRLRVPAMIAESQMKLLLPESFSYDYLSEECARRAGGSILVRVEGAL